MKNLQCIILCLSLFVAGILAFEGKKGACKDDDGGDKGWPSWGRDIEDTNFNPRVQDIKRSNVHKLDVRWRKDTNGTVGVSSTPTTDGKGKVYVTDWHGNVWCLDEEDGSEIWRVRLPDITGDPASVSRTSATLAKTHTGREVVILGDQGTPTLFQNFTFCAMNPGACGASMYAFDRFTGDLVWRVVVDAQPSAIITASPTIYGQWIYCGVSSTESALAAFVPGYPCCSFRGSFFAQDVSTGVMKWRHWNIPAGGEYSGATSWGSSPAVDPEDSSVYFGTSNLYSQPARISACLMTPGNTPYDCLEPEVLCDALIKVDMFTGERKWARPFHGVDAWNVDCNPGAGPNGGVNCPQPTGPDYDVGHGPILYKNACGEKVVAVVQKSGIVWNVDAATGETNWRTAAGPGSTLQNTWGSSFDGKRIYMSHGNFDRKGYLTLEGELQCDGHWIAVDAFTGKVEWITPVPGSRPSSQCPDPSIDPTLTHILSDDEQLFTDRTGNDNDDDHHDYRRGRDISEDEKHIARMMANDDGFVHPDLERHLETYRHTREVEDIRDSPLFATAHGSVNAIRGVVFGGAMTGYMYAFDSRNGEIKWSFRCPTGSVYGGAAIDEHEKDTVYWGCGYGRLLPFFQGDRYVYAFDIQK